MSTSIIVNILLILQATTLFLTGHVDFYTRGNDKQDSQIRNIPFVSFCEVFRAPEKYSGKILKTKAIIVVVIGPTAQGPTIMYSQSCNKKKAHMIVDDHATLLLPKEITDNLEKIMKSQSDGRGIARAEVTVTGKFIFPMNDTLNKHNASMQVFTLKDIKSVKGDVKWPLN